MGNEFSCPRCGYNGYDYSANEFQRQNSSENFSIPSQSYGGLCAGNSSEPCAPPPMCNIPTTPACNPSAFCGPSYSSYCVPPEPYVQCGVSDFDSSRTCDQICAKYGFKPASFGLPYGQSTPDDVSSFGSNSTIRGYYTPHHPVSPFHSTILEPNNSFKATDISFKDISDKDFNLNVDIDFDGSKVLNSTKPIIEDVYDLDPHSSLPDDPLLDDISNINFSSNML